MTRAFIGLGSNRGVPLRQLQKAKRALAEVPNTTVCNVSPVYETQPQNKTDQPWFSNQVLELECGTQWIAPALLNILLSLEIKLGRDRIKGARFGPRLIDLDLLLFGNEILAEPQLTLPHPRMFERAFVLVPLSDIAPDLVFPDGSAIQHRLAALHYNLSDGRIHQESGANAWLSG